MTSIEINIPAQHILAQLSDTTSALIDVSVETKDELVSALASATEGTVIRVMQGNYQFTSTLNIPSGVSIIGNVSETVHFVFANVSDAINLTHQQRVKLENIIFAGGLSATQEKLVSSGLVLQFSKDITVKNCSFTDFEFSAIKIIDAERLLVEDTIIHDAAGDAGGWLSGNISIAKLKDSIFRRVKIIDKSETKGYGIKFFPIGNFNCVRNVKIDDCFIDVGGVSSWSPENSVPNFSIELYNTDAQNIEICNSTIMSMMSFSTDEYAGRRVCHVHDCQILSQYAECFEMSANGLLFENNSIISDRFAPFINWHTSVQDITIRKNKIIMGHEASRNAVYHTQSSIQRLIMSDNEIMAVNQFGAALLSSEDDDTSIELADVLITGNFVERMETLTNGVDSAIKLSQQTTSRNLQLIANKGVNFAVNQAINEENTQINCINIGNKVE